MAQETPNTFLNALIGAIVTIVLSFTLISPLIGGAVAGYLQQNDGARVGAISGVIASIPLILGVLAFGIFMVGAIAFLFGLIVLFFVVIFGTVWVVGLSALGGYLGVYIRNEL